MSQMNGAIDMAKMQQYAAFVRESIFVAFNLFCTLLSALFGNSTNKAKRWT
jgi:hypothetical protein